MAVPRRGRLGNHAVGTLQTSVVLWSEAERLSRGCCTLVGLRQAQSSDGGGHKEGAAGQDRCGPGVKDRPAVQGLHRPEGPHHWLPVVELELRERP